MLLCLLLAYAHTTFAEDPKYAETMSKNIETLYTSQSIPILQNAVNTLERIGLTEKTKWEPYYYSAFGNLMMANKEQDGAKKDSYLDQALAAIKKAEAIKSNYSEIVALEGFVHMVRITVDPSSRGQQYSSLAMQTFGKAIALNPDNPRALALMAQMQFGTAQFFGSSTAEACLTNEAALKKFETFKVDNDLAPQWGKAMAEGTKSKCN